MTENLQLKIDETADSIHGRLLEAVHITGYTFERACTELEWLLKENRWKAVGQKFEDIDAFLKTIDFSSFKIAIEQRKKLAKHLEKLRATQRATAKMLGVGIGTVNRDLDTVPIGTELASEPAPIKEENEKTVPLGTKPSLTIAQSGEDVARLAEKAAKKEEATAINLQVRHDRLIAETKAAIVEKAIVVEEDCLTILETIPPIDLLLTDPPYFTDGDFTNQISACLSKVKPTGQAYIFSSSDPAEFAAYLKMNTHHMNLEQILIWNYNNTGQRQPNNRYISNYQVIFYYRGPDAPIINKPGDGTYQYACQTVNAPDGRIGDRFHEWQKPLELIERLIRNSSKPEDFIFDPFAGSGTTMLAAAKLGRKVIGCDIDPEAINICLKRGCVKC